MKKLIAMLLCVAMCFALLAGCGGKKTPSNDASNGSKPAGEGTVKVGFSMKTLEGPYFVVLINKIEEMCKELGWECTTLDASMDSVKEAENMETFITNGVDLIFLDSVDPTACIPSINKAADAGIPVVNLDSGVGECKQVTTIYSDNYQNGRLVGKAYAATVPADQEIIAIMISSLKGNVACTERRTGLYCGILEQRLGCTEDEAWKLAEEFEKQVATAGSAANADAKFTVRGQCWGDAVRSQALEVSEDMITANMDLNCILSDASDNLLGGVKAADNAGLKDVAHMCAADASLEVYDLIKAGKVFGIGENSPAKVAMKGMEVAQQLILEDADWDSFEEVIRTEAIAVTKDNVDACYEYGF